MNASVLPNAMVAGGSVLALWVYVRLGSWRPKSFGRILIHVVIAALALSLLQISIDVASAGRSTSGTLTLFAFFLPAVTYAFLAALYLLEHLQRALSVR